MVTEEDYYKLSEVIIAYTKTNFSDHENRMTDVVTGVGGNPNLYVVDGFSLPEKAEDYEKVQYKLYKQLGLS